MTTFKDTIIIDAPKERVWATIADLGGIQQFHPGVSRSYYLSDQREGVGASRRCELLPMGTVDEKAVDWQPGREFTLEIVPGPKAPPFKEAHGRMWVEEDEAGTLVGLQIDYQLKFGPLGRVMDRFLVQPQFRKVVPRILRGLKRYQEDGDVNPNLRQAS